MAKRNGKGAIAALAATVAAKAKEAALTVSTKARKFAAELVMNAALMQELAGDYFSLVRQAFTEGCTFEELESAEPSLKQVQAYRSAKSALRQAKEQGVSLVNPDGSMKGRTALEKEVKAKKAADAGEDAVTVTPGKKGANSAKYSYGDVHSMIQAAFGVLKTEPTMRKAYRDVIMETARALANDEATVEPRRTPKSEKRTVGATSAPIAPKAPMSTEKQRDKARKVDAGELAARQAAADAAAAPRTGTHG